MLTILTLGSFVFGLNSYMISGILSSLAINFHTSQFLIGQLVTIFALSYAFISPFIVLSLTKIKPKFTLSVSCFVFAIANLISAYTHEFMILAITRCITGTIAGIFMPTAFSLVPLISSQEKRGRNLSIIVCGSCCSVALGVPFGVEITDYLSWQWVFILSAVLAMLVAVLIYLYAPKNLIIPIVPLRARIAAICDKRASFIALITAIDSLSGIGAYTYISLLPHTIKLTLIFFAWGVGAIIGSLSIGIISDRVGSVSKLVTVVLALQGLGIIGAYLSCYYMPVLLIPSVFLWGFAGWAIVGPQQNRILNIRPHTGAAGSSINASALYLGSALGALLGGVIIDKYSIELLFYSFGTLVIITAVFNYYLTGRNTGNSF